MPFAGALEKITFIYLFLFIHIHTFIPVQLVVSPNRQISPRSPVQRQEPNDPAQDSRLPIRIIEHEIQQCQSNFVIIEFIVPVFQWVAYVYPIEPYNLSLGAQ